MCTVPHAIATKSKCISKNQCHSQLNSACVDRDFPLLEFWVPYHINVLEIYKFFAALSFIRFCFAYCMIVIFDASLQVLSVFWKWVFGIPVGFSCAFC